MGEKYSVIISPPAVHFRRRFLLFCVLIMLSVIKIPLKVVILSECNNCLLRLVMVSVILFVFLPKTGSGTVFLLPYLTFQNFLARPLGGRSGPLFLHVKREVPIPTSSSIRGVWDLVGRGSFSMQGSKPSCFPKIPMGKRES